MEKNRGASNDTLLIVDAINKQTEILKEVMSNMEKRIDKIEVEVQKNSKIINEMCYNRCINNDINFNGFTIKLKTILIILFVIECIQLLNYVDSNIIQSILLSLI